MYFGPGQFSLSSSNHRFLKTFGVFLVQNTRRPSKDAEVAMKWSTGLATHSYFSWPLVNKYLRNCASRVQCSTSWTPLRSMYTIQVALYCAGINLDIKYSCNFEMTP